MVILIKPSWFPNIHQGRILYKTVEFGLNGFDMLEFIVGGYNEMCAYGVFDYIILRFYSCQQSLWSSPKLKNKYISH